MLCFTRCLYKDNLVNFYVTHRLITVVRTMNQTSQTETINQRNKIKESIALNFS